MKKRYPTIPKDPYEVSENIYKETKDNLIKIKQKQEKYHNEWKIFIINYHHTSYGKFVPYGRTLNERESQRLFEFSEKFGYKKLQEYIVGATREYLNEYNINIIYTDIDLLLTKLRIHSLEQPVTKKIIDSFKQNPREK